MFYNLLTICLKYPSFHNSPISLLILVWVDGLIAIHVAYEVCVCVCVCVCEVLCNQAHHIKGEANVTKIIIITIILLIMWCMEQGL